MPIWLQTILTEYGSNPFKALWFVFGHGGALVLIPIMIRMATTGWIFWLQEQYKHHMPHTMYKIEVPQNNEQSMKAVEQIFSQLYGAYNVPDWWEKWWLGFVQEEYSFEIVSDGGYITFYLRTPTKFKEIVQSAFYSHYPDAILTETEDYTKEINVDMINDKKVLVWGSEMKLEADDVRPIKPYPAFEHQLTGKAVDPLANILELMSRMQPGEKLWYQIMAQPTDLNHLKHRAEEAITAVVEPGKAGHHGGPDILDHLTKFIWLVLGTVHKMLFGGEDDAGGHEEASAGRERLTNPEKEFVDEVDKKASRWPFHTKVRFMYFAPPNMYDSTKARRGMLGGFRLYRYINAFVEGTLTRTDWGCLPYRYIRPEPRLLARARHMFWAYRSRDMERGEHEGFVLSTEELTALFHFPSIDVRAPFVAKAQSRGVEPPTLLRYDNGDETTGPTIQLEKGNAETASIPKANMVVEVPTGFAAAAEPPRVQLATEATPTRAAQPAVSVEAAPEASQPEAPANLPFVD